MIGNEVNTNRKRRSQQGHESFFRNTVWQYGLQILKYLFPLVLIPYLTRVLGTDTYAIYAYVYSFMGVIQTIADFGFTLSGTKKVVEHRDDRRALSKLVGDITIARLMLLAILLIATLLISVYIPIMSENVPYVVLALVAVGFRALLPDFVFQGFEQMGPLTTRYFASKGAQVLLTLLLVRGPGDLLLVALADVVGSAIGLVWSFAATKRMFGVGISAPSLRQSLLELKDSAIYCVSEISSSLFSGFTTIVIGLALTDRTDIAFWSLALTTVNAVQALYTPIVNSLYPHMLNNRDFGFARRLALIAAPALVVGTAAYCLLAEQIMFVLGGSDYLGAAHVMRMVSPVLPISFYAMFIGWPILGAMGYVKGLTITTVIAGVFNVISLLVLYVTGLATLDSICVVRWLVEIVMLGSRGFLLARVTRTHSSAAGPFSTH
jgi:PST family polysaccharide transporter